MSKSAQRKQTQTTSFSQRQRTTLIRNVALIAVAVLVVGAGIWYVVDQTVKGEQDKVRPDANPAEQTIPDEGRGHVEVGSPLTFKHYPPSSGTHYGTTLPQLGFYDQTWSEGYWVHNLEHGDVVILYNCSSDCPELKAKLKTLVENAPKRQCPTAKLIALPYSTGMTTQISVVAWGKQLDVAGYDEKAILDFYKRYEDRGPELLGCQQ